MKSKQLIELFRTNSLVIPNILLKSYRELKLDEKELILMAYLMSNYDLIPFDPSLFSKELGFELNDVMEIISDLSSKKYVEVVVKKENSKMKEYLNIELFYERLALLLIEETQEKDSEQDSEIYSVIESEFGRTLSPIECETISHWLNANISEDLIKEALKEAVLNGVNNLKYIDKILYDWGRKGYKKPSDIKKKKKKESAEIEIFSYDWLDEND